MLRIMNYASPESLDEAYALLTKIKEYDSRRYDLVEDGRHSDSDCY